MANLKELIESGWVFKEVVEVKKLQFLQKEDQYMLYDPNSEKLYIPYEVIRKDG